MPLSLDVYRKAWLSVLRLKFPLLLASPQTPSPPQQFCESIFHPKKICLQYSKPGLAEFPLTILKQHENVEPNLPDGWSMQNLVIQIQLDFKERITLKDEEINIYLVFLSTLGMTVPRRLPPPNR